MESPLGSGNEFSPRAEFPVLLHPLLLPVLSSRLLLRTRIPWNQRCQARIHPGSQSLLGSRTSLGFLAGSAAVQRELNLEKLSSPGLGILCQDTGPSGPHLPR